VRLEGARVLEDRDVTRQHVAGPEREREGQPRQGEAAHLGARSHALAGDARDVAREMPVNLHRQLTAPAAVRNELIVQALGEGPDLRLTNVARHRHEVMHVGAELPAEVDLPDPSAVAPIAERAAEVRAKHRRLHHASERRDPEQGPHHQRRPDHEIDRRDRPVRRPVRDADLVRRAHRQLVSHGPRPGGLAVVRQISDTVSARHRGRQVEPAVARVN
jgi:hypothetical protein